MLHCVFICNVHIKSGESVIQTQCLFLVKFNVGRHVNVPDHNTILKWVTNIRSTGSVIPYKPTGAIRTVWTPENNDRVKTEEPASFC